MTSHSSVGEKEPDLRIVLVGKTGVGKSAVGNTILGKKVFESKLSFSSLTSECKKEANVVDGSNLDVIDTPGLFETDKSNKEVVKEIAKCISMAAPGPHVFLIVLQPTRFTEEERKTVEMIQTMFGKEAAKYTMILFTQGDELKQANTNIENMLQKHPHLPSLINQCSILQTFEDKYHVLDNKVEDPGQVNELLKKIKRLVQRNGEDGGSFYSHEMFREAQRAKEEEEKRLLRENPDINPQDAKRQAENDNSFIRAAIKGAAAGAAAGALIGGRKGGAVGAAVGALIGGRKGGAVGAAVGALIGGRKGGAVGAAVGGSMGAALAVKEKACIIQ